MAYCVIYYECGGVADQFTQLREVNEYRCTYKAYPDRDCVAIVVYNPKWLKALKGSIQEYHWKQLDSQILMSAESEPSTSSVLQLWNTSEP